MRKSLLIISGGIEAIPGIELARVMGLHVIVSDGDPNAIGFKYAHDKLIASTYDVAESVAAAKDYHQNVRPINGVMCVAADVPHTVASVAQALDLHGIPVDSAFTSVDKLAMKDCFSAASVPVPWYRRINSTADLTAVVREQGYPLVVKPVDSRGSRGVLLLMEPHDLEWAYSYAKGYSPTGRVMVERFLSGPQISSESIIYRGKIYTPGLADRNYEKLALTTPHIVEDGGDLPSLHAKGCESAIDGALLRAAKALKIANGVIKGDVVIHEGIPHIIELATRLSGGYFCSHEIPLNTGVDFVGQAIKLAMGEVLNPNDLIPQFQHAVSQRYLFPKPGIVQKITGVDEVASLPGIEMCEIRVKTGDKISNIHNHPARAGVIITTGATSDEARWRAVDAVTRISIETIQE